MTVQLATPPPLPVTGVQPTIGIDRTLNDIELDIEFLEACGTVEHIIKMTEENCGSTCQSACASESVNTERAMDPAQLTGWHTAADSDAPDDWR
jgi:FxLD family lantipeptide